MKNLIDILNFEFYIRVLFRGASFTVYVWRHGMESPRRGDTLAGAFSRACQEAFSNPALNVRQLLKVPAVGDYQFYGKATLRLPSGAVDITEFNHEEITDWTEWPLDLPENYTNT